MSQPRPSPGLASFRPPAWIWAGLALLAAALSIYRSDDTDYWFHLAAGRSILAHGLPHHEAWCVAARGTAPWLSEWLFHVALQSVHLAGGDAAVAAWRALWSAIAVGLLALLLVRRGAATWPAALLMPLMLAVARDRFQPRPEQVGLAFALLELVLLERARRTGRIPFAALIGLQILWANLHPSWVFGVLFAAVYALAPRGSRENLDMSAPPASRRALAFGALVAALWIAGAVTPNPAGSLTLPFQFLANVAHDPLHASIDELRPWSWAADRAGPFTALLALAALAAALGGRRAWRASPALTLIALVGFALGLAAVRSRGFAAFLAIPALAFALDAPGGVARRRIGLGVAALACASGVAWLALAREFEPGVRPQERSYPGRAVALADSLGLAGVPLNTFHYGGYILWARGEAHPPLIDGRALGSPGFRSRYVRAWDDPLALDSLLTRWSITHAVLEPPQTPRERVAANLLARGDWALLFADDAGLLLVRRDQVAPAALAREYHWFTPDYDSLARRAERAVSDPVVRAGLVSELERARRESPLHARASLWLGLLRLAEGDGRAARDLLEEAERLAPATPGLALRLGLARRAAGDRAGAVAAFRRALHEPADAAAARAALDALGRRASPGGAP